MRTRKSDTAVLLLAVFCAWDASSPTVSAEAPTRRPNIVLIMADDVSPDMFGCYGSEDAKTPNLDRMAREGVMFQTAWASALARRREPRS